MNSEWIGVNKTVSGIGNAGFGYVVIPDDLNRNEYISKCLSSKRVTIYGGEEYGRIRNVPCSRETIQNINFPLNSADFGTGVFWIKSSQTNQPHIIATFDKDTEFEGYEENKYIKNFKFRNNNFFIAIDKENNTIDLHIVSDETSDSTVNILLSSKTKNSTLNILSDGKINVESTKELNVLTKGKVTTTFNNENEEQKAQFVYELGQGLSYTDEFENKLTLDKDGTKFTDQFNNKLSITKDSSVYEDQFRNKATLENGKVTIESKQINHNSGTEPMVLGDTLANLLSDFISQINVMTMPTPIGPTGVPINMAAFTAIQQQLDTIKSKKSNLE